MIYGSNLGNTLKVGGHGDWFCMLYHHVFPIPFRYFDRMSLLAAIKHIQFSGGRSNLQAALVKTWHSVFDGSPGDRAEVPDVIVTFSDGVPTVNVESTMSTAEDIKASGILMSAIAIGRYPSRQTLSYLSNIQVVYDETQLANQRIFSDFVAKLREAVGKDIIGK